MLEKETKINTDILQILQLTIICKLLFWVLLIGHHYNLTSLGNSKNLKVYEITSRNS